MKPFSATDKPVSRTRARNAALINQFVTPGFGSLMCGRWLAGAGQLLLALFGCLMIVLWFSKEMGAYYGMMFSDQPTATADWRVFVYGVATFAVSWVWSGITSFQLMRSAAPESNPLKEMPANKLDIERTALALASVSQWKQNGQVISRTYPFKDFPAAIKFTNAVAQAAESAGHHPDIDIRWNKVTLALTTHDAGGLTDKDFLLAKKFDELSTR